MMYPVPEESISFLEVACLTWPMFDVQVTRGQQSKWAGMLLRNVLCPSLPLPPCPVSGVDKRLCFLSLLILCEERQSCNTSHYKIQFLEAGCQGSLMHNKEEKGNLLKNKESYFLGLKGNSKCNKSIKQRSICEKKDSWRENISYMCSFVPPKMHTVKPRVEHGRFGNLP